jgi:hypothetical protein
MARAWIVRSVIRLALVASLAGCTVPYPEAGFVPERPAGDAAGPSVSSEEPAGDSLPFSLYLPDGFDITLTPGMDIATYTIKSAGRPYLYVLHQQFPAFDYRTDWKGRVHPRVQQRVFCRPLVEQGEYPPHRQILHLQRESIAPGRRLAFGEHDFILVWERIDLPAEQQAIADQIAASIHVPGLTEAVPQSALLTCR